MCAKEIKYKATIPILTELPIHSALPVCLDYFICEDRFNQLYHRYYLVINFTRYVGM